MALRLIEVAIPRAQVDALSELVSDIDIVHMRVSDGSESGGMAHFLIDSHESESLSDLLVSRFGKEDGFRLIMIPVEATLPHVEAADEKEELAKSGVRSGKLGPQRISREELYEDIANAARLSPVYIIMVGLSSIVAAVGLLRDDLAVIIGAMLIAPLLGPNVGMSLAVTLGDLDLGRRSIKAISAGVFTAAAVSVLIGLLFTVDPQAPQIVSRTQPQLTDIALALSAGVAGALAFTSGVPAVVVGVMVAVALLPPLVVTGLLAGDGHAKPALEALTLALLNVTCINLAAIGTFIAQKVSPRTWWEADRASEATRRAAIGWMILLAIVLGLIFLL